MAAASVPFGQAHVDMALRDALTGAGVAERDATEIARMDAFGGSPTGPWLEGLKAASALLIGHGHAPALDWGTLPAPWDALCPALVAADDTAGAGLADELAGYGDPVQAALLGAIGAVVTGHTQLPPDRGDAIGDPTTPAQQVRTEEIAKYLEAIDEALFRDIQKALNRTKHPASRRRKEAGELLIDWLAGHGQFLRAPLGERYYLLRDDHRLFRLGTDAWHAWLYRLTGANPAGTDFRYLDADCDAAAEEGEQREVVRVAHWDEETKTLRVSRFDGTVYRLEGTAIAEELNGDGPVVFEDAPMWVPYTPDYSAGGDILRWSTETVPNWAEDWEASGLLYRAWWLATYFTELCPTRPILVIKGEKGSGKTLSVRVQLRLLFGPLADVVGVPEKPDAFVAMTSHGHIVALDNLDDFTPALRDKLAALSTGKHDQVRELYKTNDVRTIQYRCWLAVTTRTPDTLQRDDIADRVLVLPVERVEDERRLRESLLVKEVITQRDQWWGDVLTALNQIVGELRRAGVPERGGLRMEDWAALGSVVARAGGLEAVWERAIERVRHAQGALLLEDDVIAAALEMWLASSQYTDQWIPTRDLYKQTTLAFFGLDRPDSTWPRSVKSFGRRLAGMRRELAARLAQDGVYLSWDDTHGREMLYRFVK